MAVLLLIGDLHYGVNNIAQTEEFERKIVALVEQRFKEIDTIVLLGDVLDKERINSALINRVRKLLSSLAKLKQVYVIGGNHELPHNSLFLTENSALMAFKDMENVNIVLQPQRIVTGWDFTDKVFACPYVPPGRFQEAIGPVIIKSGVEPDLILCHQEFRGADMGGIISEHGDVWGNDSCQVISGHIHSASSPQPQVLYVGTPYPITFAETDRKTVMLYNTETKAQERIDLNIAKRVTLEVDLADIDALVIPEDNNYYRITINGDEEGLIKFKLSKKYRELSEKHKVIIKKSDTLKRRKNSDNLDFISFLRRSVESESQEINEVLTETLGRVGNE